MPWEDVEIIDSEGCCALDEIINLQDDPVQTLLGVSEHRKQANNNVASQYMSTFYVFSDAVDFKRGEKLAKYLTDKALGPVIETRAAYNPKSKRNVKVYVWTISTTKFDAWAKKHKKELEEPEEDDEDDDRGWPVW